MARAGCARGAKKLKKDKEASAIFNELLANPDAPEAFHTLKVKVMALAVGLPVSLAYLSGSPAGFSAEYGVAMALLACGAIQRCATISEPHTTTSCEVSMAPTKNQVSKRCGEISGVIQREIATSRLFHQGFFSLNAAAA